MMIVVLDTLKVGLTGPTIDRFHATVANFLFVLGLALLFVLSAYPWPPAVKCSTPDQFSFSAKTAKSSKISLPFEVVVSFKGSGIERSWAPLCLISLTIESKSRNPVSQ